MSYVLYNESAYNYELTIIKTENEKIADLETEKDAISPSRDPKRELRCEPIEYQERLYQTLNSFIKDRPLDYRSLGCASSTWRLLERNIKEFYFPAEGLRGTALNLLVEKLYQFLEANRTKRFSGQVKEIALFLSENKVVYRY